MSAGTDLATYDVGDGHVPAIVDDGPLVETSEDKRNDLRQIIDDLKIEKQAGRAHAGQARRKTAYRT
jgi:hypothetical protein